MPTRDREMLAGEAIRLLEGVFSARDSIGSKVALTADDSDLRSLEA